MADVRADAIRDVLPLLRQLKPGTCVLEVGPDESKAVNYLIEWLKELVMPRSSSIAAPAGMDAESRYMLNGYILHFYNPEFGFKRGQSLWSPLSSAWLDTIALVQVKRLAQKWLAKTLSSKKMNGSSQALSAELAETVFDWSNFDAANIHKLSEGKPLESTANAVITKLGMVDRLKLNRSKLSAYLAAIEEIYKPNNPYHNNTHAADVVQGVACVINSDGLASKLTDLEALALVLAAVVHDAGHPGVNNAYLVRVVQGPAITYSDLAVNEYGHLALAFETLFHNHEYNFFADMAEDDWRYVRRLVVDLVLGTDMAQHTKDLNNFTSTAKLMGNDFDTWVGEARVLALRFILHACDISNPARPWSVCLDWAARITAENFQQGDRERLEGLPVSPVCDREKANPVKGQQVFATLFVRPTWEALGVLCPSLSKVAVAHLDANALRYERLLEKGVTQIPAAWNAAHLHPPKHTAKLPPIIKQGQGEVGKGAGAAAELKPKWPVPLTKDGAAAATKDVTAPSAEGTANVWARSPHEQQNSQVHAPGHNKTGQQGDGAVAEHTTADQPHLILPEAPKSDGEGGLGGTGGRGGREAAAKCGCWGGRGRKGKGSENQVHPA